MNRLKQKIWNFYKRINRNFNHFEYKLGKTKLVSSPYIYHIPLTNVCNLKCPLCKTGLGMLEKPAKFIDCDLFDEILKKIKPYVLSLVLYNDGESLLHKDFEKIVKICYDNNLNSNASLSSNLSIPNIDAKLEALVKYQFGSITVSFDGVDQASHSRYRRGGDFELVLSNVKKIKMYKEQYKSKYPLITLQYLENRFTTNEIEVIRDNYKDWGADEYVVRYLVSLFGDSEGRYIKEWVPDDEEREYWDAYQDCFGKRCRELYNRMVINEDGTIPVCCFATDPFKEIGKWDSELSINEMFNSEAFVASRMLFRNKSVSVETPCCKCSILKSFKGG